MRACSFLSIVFTTNASEYSFHSNCTKKCILGCLPTNGSVTLELKWYEGKTTKTTIGRTLLWSDSYYFKWHWLVLLLQGQCTWIKNGEQWKAKVYLMAIFIQLGRLWFMWSRVWPGMWCSKMVNSEWPKQLFIWYGQLYLISNWAVFDLCEAESGLACDFHGLKRPQ